MKIIENNKDFPAWLSALCNWLAIDSDLMHSIGSAFRFQVNGVWTWVPRITGNEALFYNAVLFIRIAFPFHWVGAFAVWWLSYLLLSEFWDWLLALQVLADYAEYIWYLLFLKVVPFGLFWGIRWSDNPERKRQFHQGGVGWKLNGRPGFLFRFSSDKAAAKGTTGPNYGQAQGFEYGTH